MTALLLFGLGALAFVAGVVVAFLVLRDAVKLPW